MRAIGRWSLAALMVNIMIGTSLNESDNAVSGIVVFCGEREPAGFGRTLGVLVSVFLPNPCRLIWF